MSHTTQLCSCGNDIKIISIPSFEILTSFAPHIQFTDTVAWNSDSNIIVSTGKSDQVKIHLWFNKIIETREFGQNRLKHNFFKFSNTSPNIMASCGNDLISIVWDVQTQSPLQAFEGLPSLPLCVSFSHHDQHLCVGCDINMSATGVAVFDLKRVANTQAMNIIQFPKDEGVSKIKISKISSSFIATLSSKDIIRIIDMETFQFNQTFQNDIDSNVVDIMLSNRNDGLIMKACNNGYVRFYDVKQQLMIKSIECGETLTCIEQSKDGKTLIFGTNNGKILFYDMRKITEPLHKLKAHTGPVKCVSISTNTKDRSHSKESKERVKQKNRSESREFQHFKQVSIDSLSSQEFSESNVNTIPPSTLLLKCMEYEQSQKFEKKVHKVFGNNYPYETSLSDSKTTLSSNTTNSREGVSLSHTDTNISLPKHKIEYSDDSLTINYDNIETIKAGDFLNIKKSINQTLKNSLFALKDDIHRDISSLHVELLKQLQFQKTSFQDIKKLENRLDILETENANLKVELNKLKNKKM